MGIKAPVRTFIFDDRSPGNRMRFSAQNQKGGLAVETTGPERELQHSAMHVPDGPELDFAFTEAADHVVGDRVHIGNPCISLAVAVLLLSHCDADDPNVFVSTQPAGAMPVSRVTGTSTPILSGALFYRAPADT